MRLMGHRLLEILLIHRKYVLILVGETDLRLIVQMIEVTSAVKSKLLTVMNRLSASSDASAWTCHDFYEIIMHLSSLNLIQQRPCIPEAADYRRTYFHIVNGKFCLHHSVVCLKFRASDCLKRICRRILLLEQIICGTKRRLHHSAGYSKDNARTRTLLHRTVACAVF